MKLISQHTVIAVPVQDQDKAQQFYTQQLGLEVRSDVTFGPGLRLLTVAPMGQARPELALAKIDHTFHGAEQRHLVPKKGLQTFVFTTDNCYREYEQLNARGITFMHPPTRQLYGIEAVFVDPDGNAFTLLETSPEAHLHFAQAGFWTAA